VCVCARMCGDFLQDIPGESPKLSQAALCCLISVCHAEDVTQPLEWSCHLV